jgi:hypothetical protein
MLNRTVIPSNRPPMQLSRCTMVPKLPVLMELLPTSNRITLLLTSVPNPMPDLMASLLVHTEPCRALL